MTCIKPIDSRDRIRIVSVHNWALTSRDRCKMSQENSNPNRSPTKPSTTNSPKSPQKPRLESWQMWHLVPPRKNSLKKLAAETPKKVENGNSRKSCLRQPDEPRPNELRVQFTSPVASGQDYFTYQSTKCLARALRPPSTFPCDVFKGTRLQNERQRQLNCETTRSRKWAQPTESDKWNQQIISIWFVSIFFLIQLTRTHRTLSQMEWNLEEEKNVSIGQHTNTIWVVLWPTALCYDLRVLDLGKVSTVYTSLHHRNKLK